MKKKLPIGIQTFKKIIDKDCLYVDKTKQIHDIITTGTTYFLARPRRFGKSLLCSTLEEIFKGNKELFKGLWIYDSNYDWQQHPVIRMDMTKIAHDTPEELKTGLNEKIEEISKQNNILIDYDKTLQTKFSTLVSELSKNNKVAIIIDEYDKPILDHITDTKTADKMREVLRTFYSQLKALDEYLKFIFITGVSRFSKTSIFSGLNNLRDLTFSKKAATLLGYTQSELEFYFKERIQELASQQHITKDQIILKLKDWYNGYRFIEYAATVYNPFSILLVLDEFSFKNYWFETGTPTFLFNLMKDQNIDHTDKNLFKATEAELGNFEIKTLPVKTILYQTGYLTIKDFNPERRRYFLDFPNYEVKESFLEFLLNSLTKIELVVVSDTFFDLVDALKDNNVNEFINTLKIFFAQIPYKIQNKNEKYYQSIFFIILKLVGVKIDVELYTNIGRIDAVITLDDYIYIFEFKINQTAKKALQQIEDKKYYEGYREKNKRIITVGINFDTKEKNISDFKVKEIG